MNANAIVNRFLLVSTEETRRRNEKQIYLELWDVLMELLERPYADLTHEDMLHMDRIAHLLHDYEERLYPTGKRSIAPIAYKR